MLVAHFQPCFRISTLVNSQREHCTFGQAFAHNTYVRTSLPLVESVCNHHVVWESFLIKQLQLAWMLVQFWSLPRITRHNLS